MLCDNCDSYYMPGFRSGIPLHTVCTQCGARWRGEKKRDPHAHGQFKISSPRWHPPTPTEMMKDAIEAGIKGDGGNKS